MRTSLEAAVPVTSSPAGGSVPACIGIIMDGNRRWAKARRLPPVLGHKHGAEKLKEVLGWCQDRSVKNLIVYAFSTENWDRPEDEVGYLMDTIRRFFRKQGKDLEDFKRRGGRLRFVGERGHFAPDIQALLTQAEADTSGDGCMLWVALSYGGRAEILAAVRKLIVAGTLPESIDESSFGNALWTAGMPDPDIIIRTSGEKRLSGFLPWQGVYSELFFTDTLWPDFSERELDAILAEYATRERRHGK